MTRTLVALTFIFAMWSDVGLARASEVGSPNWTATGGYVAVSAGNAKALGRWYVEMLDFRVLREQTIADPKMDIVILTRGNALVEILQPAGAAGPPLGERGWRDAWRTQGYFKAGIFVDNLDAAEKVLRARNAKFAFGPMKASDDPFRSFAVVDPEGNVLQFFGV